MTEQRHEAEASSDYDGIGSTISARFSSNTVPAGIVRSNSDPSILPRSSDARDSVLATFLRGASTSSSSSDPTSSSRRSNTSSADPASYSSRIGSVSRARFSPQEYQYTFPWLPHHRVILFPQSLSAIPQQSQSSSRQESDPSQTSQSNVPPYLLSSPPRQASVSTALSSIDVPEILDPPPFPLDVRQTLNALPLQTPATSAECLTDGRSRMSPPASPKQLHPVDFRVVPARKSSIKPPKPLLTLDQSSQRETREYRTARFANESISPVSPISPQSLHSPQSPLSPLSPLSRTSLRSLAPPSPLRIPRKPLPSQVDRSARASLDRPLPPLPRTVAFKSQQELIRDRILERARANAIARYREISGSQIRRGSRPSYKRFYGTDHQNLRDPVVLTSRFIKETSINPPRLNSFSHPALRKTSSVSFQPSQLSQRSQKSRHSSSQGNSSSTRGGSGSARGGSNSTRGGSRSTRGGSSSTDSSRRGPHHIIYRAPHEPETIWERYVNRRRAILEREALDANRYSGSTHWTWRDSYMPYSPTMEPIPDKDKASTENSSDQTLSEPDNGRSQEARLRDLSDAQHNDVPPIPGIYNGEKIADADLERAYQTAGSEGGSERDPNIVDWDAPDDPENPMNWTFTKKTVATVAMGVMTFVVTFASSVFSTATNQVSQEYSVSLEVAILGTALFVLGFVPGPIIWGPLSELYGRKYPLFFGYFVFALFSIGVATSQNIWSILICRFLGGLFGCATFAIAGGALADFYGPIHRGVATCIFAGATFAGPAVGPVIGGFIAQSSPGWRWTEYITAIMAFISMALGWFLIPESYAPLLLSSRAKKIRFETKNWAIRAKFDESQVDMAVIVQKYLLRPFKMLILEPILLLVTIYLAFIYGLLYLFFEAYPVSFQLERGWNEGVAGLPFLALLLGIVIGCGVITYMTKTRYAARLIANGGRLIPEERLPAMIVGACLLPIGLFWFAWTSNPNIHWAPQVISGAVIGAGILMIFLQGLNYIIDCYSIYANSALAANTFVRGIFGAVFPLFATAMYKSLGVAWATSTMAFVSLALLPVPILFFLYGKKLRSMSKFGAYE